MNRQTFTVHAGTSAASELLFLEVREDGLVLRDGRSQGHMRTEKDFEAVEGKDRGIKRKYWKKTNLMLRFLITAEILSQTI